MTPSIAEVSAFGPKFVQNYARILNSAGEKFDKVVNGYIANKKNWKKIQRLNEEIKFSKISLISKFFWNQIKVEDNQSEDVYAVQQVDDILKAMCSKERTIPEKRFIYKKEYWSHSELNNRICQAVTILDKQFSEEEKQSFLTEFCSGARGVDDQCGTERHIQVSLVVDRVIMGVFGPGKEVDLDVLIKKEMYSSVIQIAKEEFINSGYGEEEENRREFKKILKGVTSGKGLPPPEVAAKRILMAVQNHYLMSPRKWRVLLESTYSSEAFLTSSKNKLGQTFAAVLNQDCCQLTIRSILFRMKKLGMLRQYVHGPVHNDYDCLELLALSKKLPEKCAADNSVVDQPTLKAAISQYFHPASALINGLSEIMLHGRNEQIDLMRQILEGTPEMVLLDQAVALNLSDKEQ